MIILKSKSELAIMRKAGRINARVLAEVREAIRPGVITRTLDELAARVLAQHKATSAFKGYRFGDKLPFPGVLTICVNDELVHGIPGERRLKEGDLVSIDCGTVYQGYIGDSAFSCAVGEAPAEVNKILGITNQALELAIAASQAGNRVGDIGAAIQDHVEAQGYEVVRGYGGHGVGRTMHEEPHVPNHGPAGRGKKLRPGMTIAIEPMVLAGSREVKTLDDGWTVVSVDGQLTAHCEHTVVITENGPEILTLPD